MIEELRRMIEEALAPIDWRNRRVVLLDFPEYWNLGDLMIWLGTQRYLRSVGAKTVQFSRSERLADVARAVRPSDLILLQGGGNWGDLWPEHQEYRLRVLARFSSHEIVVLPQTVWFSSGTEGAASIAAVEACGNITLCVRDRKSLESARSFYRTARLVLCPDMALYSPIRPCRVAVDSHNTLLILRNDRELNREGVESVPPVTAIIDWVDMPTRFDWIVMNSLRRVSGNLSRAYKLLLRLGVRVDVLNRLKMRAFGMATDRYLRAAARVLSRYEHVYSTRMHGHILSVLMRKQNTLIANSYFKNRAFYDCWTHVDERSSLIP